MAAINCPYCDASVQTGTNFCPKCGLPLKDDVTLSGNRGAYLTDDSGGPNLWAVVAGIAGIVTVALGIGWLGARNSKPETQTVRQPAGGYGVSGPSWLSPQGSGFPVYGTRSSAPPPFAAAGTQTRWAYTPPAGGQPVMTASMPLMDPTPPPIPMMAMNLFRAPEPVYVTRPRATAPEIPAAPEVVSPAAGVVTDPAALPATEPTSLESNGYGPTPPLDPEDSQWVYDPVHERYAVRPDWHPRRAPTPGGFRPQGNVNRRFMRPALLNNGANGYGGPGASNGTMGGDDSNASGTGGGNGSNGNAEGGG
jgi:hypothetical protein